MKPMTKFQLGRFIEVDDLSGGRKVSLVAKDAVTMWDLLDVERVTPISIHPALNPVNLGTLNEFAKANRLIEAIVPVSNFLRAKNLVPDGLRVMRMLWSLKGVGAIGVPTEAVLTKTWASVQAQEAQVVRMHELTAQACAVT